MKKSLIFLVSLLLFNCSEDANVNETTVEQNLKTNPITFTSASLFNSEALKQQLEHPETKHFKFKITLNDKNTIVIKSVAININNKELSTVTGTGDNYKLDMERLKNMQNVPLETINAEGEVLAKHTIQPQVAYNYINAWQAILKSGVSIKDHVSFEGAYVKYGIIEKEIIAAMINKANNDRVAIFWGLNTEKKLTPVFMGIDHSNNVMLNTNKDGDPDYIYDTVRLCPPFGQGGVH